ncbi:MAG: hypothetical protein M1608_03475 [Candidatus Omnitrophica bacterium]|nr:hypothetical protein [Candidatus Omnitrophota bacterium]
MQTTAQNLIRFQPARPAFALFVGFWLAGGAVFGAEEGSATQPAESDQSSTEQTSESTPTQYNNWFDVSVGSAFVNGDEAQFMRRYGIRKGPAGGVESFHYEQPVTKNTTLKLDGRGIFDNHDYSIKLDLTDPELGYIRGGYQEYRTWFDGNGGFFPPDKWYPPSAEEMHLDRGDVWFEAGLTIPDVPVFTFRYEHQFRRGQEDSLEWGPYDVNYPAFPTNIKNIVPSFYDIDEKRDIFSGDMRHTLGNTGFGVGVRYEMSDNRDSINYHYDPEQSLVARSPNRYVTTTEEVKTDMFSAHAFTQTRFNEKILLTSGYSFTTLDTDLSGSRIYGAGYEPLYDPTFDRRQYRDTGFLDLSGGSHLNQYVLNLNLMVTPWDHFTVTPAFRVEKEDWSGLDGFTETDVGQGPAYTTSTTDLRAANDRDMVDVSESLDLRYNGVTNWIFYGRGDWTEGDGDLHVNEIEAATGGKVFNRVTDDTQLTQKYTVGANWYPLRRLNFAAQYYHKIHNNDYDQINRFRSNPPTDLYPGFLTDQNFETDDTNFRVTYRPLANLSLVTRYDFQLSTVDTTGDALGEVQSAEVTSHIIGETISWNPLARLYFQGGLNYVLDETHTPANDLGGNATDLVLPAKNDYWEGSLMAGFALTEKTELQAQYLYYRADDYVDNTSYSLPYGVSAEEHGVTVTLIQKLSERMRLTLKYGYFTNRDDTSGGFNNYDAHLVYSSLHYLF